MLKANKFREYLKSLGTRVILLIVVLGIFVLAGIAQAGFGIQPPYVKPNKPIFAGTHYEQKITLLRSSADADMQALIKVSAPEISDWITIDKGETFDLPIDKLRVPMVVMIDVPDDAEIGNYKGHLNVKITPKENSLSSGVAIALGARVEIDITITDESFVDFIVRKVDIPSIEQLKKPWEWKIFSWFFYRVRVVMKIENTGNTKIAPSRVHIDIYDNAKKELLESHDDKKIEKIEPFKTKSVEATFPTNLEAGEYWGKISIYKDKDIIQKNEIIFTVFAPGKALTPLKLGKWPYIMMSSLILVLLLILSVLIKIKIWNHLWLVFMIITWPIRFVFKIIRKFFKFLKLKFWRWMHAKASKYQNKD